MKSGDKLRTMALRGVLSEISRLEKDVRREPNDAEILQIIKRERAKREESLEFARAHLDGVPLAGQAAGDSLAG